MWRMIWEDPATEREKQFVEFIQEAAQKYLDTTPKDIALEEFKRALEKRKELWPDLSSEEIYRLEG